MSTATLFFTADDGTQGRELWKSDGTATGTVLVKDIRSGSASSDPNSLTNVDGTLFFSAYQDAIGWELWTSDGTAAGTTLVKDIYPGSSWYSSPNGGGWWIPNSSYPGSLTNVNGKLFFAANDGIAGSELWTSNGTAGDTVLVKDINPGGDFSFPMYLTNVNGTMYFRAMDDTHGQELWKSDGTAAGTTLVKDILPGIGWSLPMYLTNVNGTLFFRADDGTHGGEFWKSDGTADGTVLVKDINTVAASSSPSSLTNVNGSLFFSAYDETHGRELWKSDGTATGTTVVKDINAGIGWSLPTYLTDVNGTLFFADVLGYDALWKSDGTADGTVLLKQFDFDDILVGGEAIRNLTNVDGTLFFTDYNDTDGMELWKSDGTADGTTLVTDIYPGGYGGGYYTGPDPNSSYPSNLTNVNGTLFFRADDGTDGRELWKSDGTAAGTVLVKDIYPGSSSDPYSLTNFNGSLFFSANDGTTGWELWTSDGTAAGTVLVKDINPSYGGSSPANLIDLNGTLFFVADDGANGRELWKSDGSAAGTVLVKDIVAGGSSLPNNLTNVNGTLFFVADDGANGRELWKSDGTAAGTVLVKDINSGSASSTPISLTNVSGVLFFKADDGTGVWKLWQSDGTADGTVLVTDLVADSLTSVNGTLFFTADDGIHGNELWMLAEGTSLDLGGFPATITAGVAGSFTVTAKKADGTTDTSYLGTVHFTSSDPRALLPGGYTFTAADQGVHTFSATLKTAGSQSITATDIVIPSGSGTQSGITVDPAAASHFTVTGFPSPVTAGTPGSFTFTALDDYDNRATGYTGTVVFTSSDAKAVLPGNYTFTGADAGTHTFSATLKTAGNQSLTATDTANDALTGSQGSILVTAAAASRFLISAPSSVPAGLRFSMTISVVDAYGNVVTGYRGTIRFHSSDSTAKLPKNYAFTAADRGVHTFTGLVLKKRGIQTITVADTRTISLTGSVAINVL